jgi:molybdenum cofactor cytidylyltransferase
VRFAALVAAAGASSRMGSCKALLPYASSVSFARRLSEVYLVAGADPVVVTLPESPDDEARLRADLHGLPVLLVRNESPSLGLSGSVAAALFHALDVDALLLSPVDCPFVDAGLVHALVAALRTGVAAVPVLATSSTERAQSVRGHPAAFARAAFELLACAGDRGGPRAVLEALGDDVVEVPWSDPRVVEDVDTPEDYERVFGRPLKTA